MSYKKDAKKSFILDGGYNPNRTTTNSAPQKTSEGYNPERVVDMSNGQTPATTSKPAKKSI